MARKKFVETVSASYIVDIYNECYQFIFKKTVDVFIASHGSNPCYEEQTILSVV